MVNTASNPTITKGNNLQKKNKPIAKITATKVNKIVFIVYILKKSENSTNLTPFFS